MKIKKPGLLLVATLLVLSGCEKPQPGEQAPATVIYEDIKSQRLELAREFPGRVTARRMAEIRPQVGGILRERLFEEGDVVEKDQLLYKIDDAPFRVAHKEAQARLDRAKSREEAAYRHMERCINLAKNHAVPLQERDDAIAAYRELEAEIAAASRLVEKAAIDLDYTGIKAPISGIIGRSLVKEGALLSENQAEPLAVITQLDPVFVDVPLAASDLASMRRTTASKIYGDIIIENRTPAGSQTIPPIKGELLFTEPDVDEATGTVIARLQCANPDRALLPGMYVKVNLPVAVLEQALLIPQRSVARDNRNRPIAYVLTPEKEGLFRLEERVLELAGEHDGKYVATAGLKEGEFLLLEGLQKARNNILVRGELRNPEAQ